MPERLAGREIDDTPNARGLGGQQHVPGAEHVGRHDRLRTRRTIARDASPRARSPATPRAACLTACGIQDVAAFREIEAADLVSERPQVLRG